MKTKYTFAGRVRGPVGDRYLWYAPVGGDSRYEEIACMVNWFWGKELTLPHPGATVASTTTEE
jgi:hypothetical protein